jgi:chitodextrinase
MKKIISIILALLLVMSSTVVFANNGNGHGSNGKGNDKKYYDKKAVDNKSLQKYSDDIIDQILILKQKNNDKSTSIFINGKEYSSTDGPVIKYKSFQLPTKPITEGLGANVNWNAKTHTITITNGNITLVMNLETKKVKVNGFEIKNSVLTNNKKNKTIVLIKFISEVLGKNAEINEGAGAVIVDDDGSTSINDNITGKGLNQFEFSSKWNYGGQSNAYLEDNHWSSNRNAYYKVRFNGTQIKLYGATSANHGIAAVSIDNGAETYVDFYAVKRADNVLVYTSPVLTQGQHTLKVRVTGSRNSNSKGTTVTSDRVNILTSSITQEGTNIALNKTSFSDSEQPENVASKGNDGNTSTRWCAANSSSNHWWTVDLGALYNIGGSQVTWEKAGKIYKYKVEVSSDNTNWTLKVDKTSNIVTQQIQTDSYNSNSVRYVRITVTGLESGSWASFSEFKVFDISANIDTQAPTVPTGLVVTAPTAYEATLNWNASSDNVGTAGYRIYRNGIQVSTVTSGTSYRDTGLTAGTVYVYSVVAYDAAGNCSNHSSLAIVTTQTLSGSGTGLKGEYYNSKDLTDLKFTRIDETVNAYWKDNSPDSRIDSETFSIKWLGQIQPLYSERYTFYTTSDDGVRLWVNGIKVIDNWNDHSATENSGNITLTAGQKYDIKLEYYNNRGEGKIKLEWSSTSQSKQIVPKSQLYTAEADTQTPTTPANLTATPISANQISLNWTASTDNIGVVGYRVIRNGILVGTVPATTTYSDTGLAANTLYSYQVIAYDVSGNCSNHSSFATVTTPISIGNGNGLKGEYYDNIDFTSLNTARIDQNINFDWGTAAPNSSMGADEFSVRWTGQIQPLYSETYTFYTISDDGIRLWVNGTKVIDNWTEHSSTENSGAITLTAGQKYDIKLEYCDKTTDSIAKLFWSSTNQVKQIVPKSQLYSVEVVDTQAPTTPMGLTAAAISANQINLNWTAATDNIGIAGYKVYRNGNLVGTLAATTNYSDTGLVANTSYTYSVLAYDTAGNSSVQCLPVVVSTNQQLSNNLALGKSALSDSEETGNTASKGNDGNLNTRWCASDGSLNHWWKVDLGSNYNLKGSEVVWEKNKAYKYKIEVSTDGSNWALAVDKTGNTSTAQTQTDSFTVSTVRYIKITVTGLEANSWASFYEFKVF